MCHGHAEQPGLMADVSKTLQLCIKSRVQEAISSLVSKVTENERTAVISILSSMNQNKESVMQHSEDVFFLKIIHFQLLLSADPFVR